MTLLCERALLTGSDEGLEATVEVMQDEHREGMGAVIWMCLACVLVALLTLAAIIVWGV